MFDFLSNRKKIKEEDIINEYILYVNIVGKDPYDESFLNIIRQIKGVNHVGYTFKDSSFDIIVLINCREKETNIIEKLVKGINRVIKVEINELIPGED